MLIFISYASEDRNTAEAVHMALLGAGHQSFFDKAKLPPGHDYHGRIQAAVNQCDAFVFLISPHSIQPKSYTLTELKLAKTRWEHPQGHVLPVMADPVPYERIPNYLTAVTVLEPEGNLAAEVALAVGALQGVDPVPPAPVPSTAQVVMQIVGCDHNVPVAGPMGMAPGMQIRLGGRVMKAAGRTLQIVVRFSVQGGPALFANVQEPVYRDLTGLVATGTAPRAVANDDEILGDVLAIPYYALNIMPTNGMMRHALVAVAFAYIDNQMVMQSAPMPFLLNW